MKKDESRFLWSRSRRRARPIAVAGTFVLAALVVTLVAQASAAKPAYHSTPVASARTPAHGGGMVNGRLMPAQGGRPTLNLAQRTALGKAIRGFKPGARAAGAAAARPPLHGRFLGPAKFGSLAGGRGAAWTANGLRFNPAAKPLAHDLGPLRIPTRKAAMGGGRTLPPLAFINGSVQLDDRGGCVSFGANEVSIAQSSVNPNWIVATAQMYRNPDGTCGDSHAWFFTSHDGGFHWRQGTPAILTAGLASGDSGVTYDQKHNKFVWSFLEFDRSSFAGRIAAETSTDGLTWGQDVTFFNNTSTSGGDKPMITADNNPSSPHYGRVAVSWTDFTSGGQFFFDDFTDDGGASWGAGSSSVNFSSHNCGNGSSPAFDANGGLMVAWWSCNSGAHLYEEYSADGGASWPATSDTLIANIDSIEDPGTGACFLNGGGTSFRCNSFPSLAGDQNASDVSATAFAVVWSDVDSTPNGGGSSNVAQIHGISTPDAGATWNFGFFGSFFNLGDKFFPWASFSPGGRLNIGYLSREQDASGGNPQGRRWNMHDTEAGSLCRLRGGCGGDPFLTYTIDGTLSDPGSSTFIGDYDGSASQANNFDSYPSWVDDRAGVGVNDVRTAQLCYLDCYSSLAPYSPVFRGFSSGAVFQDFWQINIDPLFGGSGGNFWNAVGIRTGSDGTAFDDDMFLSPNRYFASALTGSAFGPPFNDYVVINANSGHAPNVTYNPQVHSFSTVGGPYTVEWAAGHLVISTALADGMAAGNVIRVYDSFENSGTTYYYGLRPNVGNTSIYTLALHSASAGSYQGAGGPVAVVRRNPAGQPAFISFATGANPNQWDGVVVGNDNSGAGTYNLYRDTAAPSGTVSIDGGAAATNSTSATLTLSATNPTAGDPVLDMRISTDGTMDTEPWVAYSTSASATLPSGDGTKTVLAQFRNGAGVTSAVVSDTILLDQTAPTVSSAPNPKFLTPNTLQSLAGVTPLRVSWADNDGAGSGICNTQLQVSLNGGAFTDVTLPSPTATGVNIRQTPSNTATRRYQVKVTDCAGNPTAFVAGRTYKLLIFQETSGSITYSTPGNWAQVADANAAGGGRKASTTAASSASLSFTGRGVAWVSRRGPTLGGAHVLIDGSPVGTVNLNKVSVQDRRVVFGQTGLTNAPHVLKVTVDGTAGHPEVDVDDFLVLT